MSEFKDCGYTSTTIFVNMQRMDDTGWPVGTLVVLCKDDGSDAPFFKQFGDKREHAELTMDDYECFTLPHIADRNHDDYVIPLDYLSENAQKALLTELLQENPDRGYIDRILLDYREEK